MKFIHENRCNKLDKIKNLIILKDLKIGLEFSWNEEKSQKFIQTVQMLLAEDCKLLGTTCLLHGRGAVGFYFGEAGEIGFREI